MFTIAGAKKKLQSEHRETSRLKIVHSEPKEHDYLRPVESPGLFDEDDIVDLEGSEEPATQEFTEREFLTPERREALPWRLGLA